MKYGLIGKKLGHSYSPEIHNALGNPEYVLREIPENELAEFFRKRDFRGINVTVPYKQVVMQYLDSIDPAAEKIGCVNTVINRSGKLFGYNTDIDGLIGLITHTGIEVSGKKALILGSGGTSKTARAALGALGAAEITVISRSGEDNYKNVTKKHADAELIINTTPLGMYPDTESFAIKPADFRKLSGVIDVVYNPHLTELVLRARELGIPAEGGLYMLVTQARRAHELFFDCALPDSAVEKTVRVLESKMQNIVLIGMPGCGKSTLGKMVAEALGREFFDTDQEIERLENMKTENIFSLYGEKYFRDAESRVITDLAKRSGAVIACGGGTPMRAENRRAIQRNSKVVLLTRSLSELATEGRPLSQSNEAIRELAAQREPIYRALCDCIVSVSADADTTCRRILSTITEI